MTQTKPPSTPVSGDENILSRIDEIVFYLQKHKNILIGVVAGIIIIGAGIFFYNKQQVAHNKKAAEALAKISPVFIEGDFNKAIYGDGENIGLLEITSSYSGTDFANIANLYLGKAYYAKGNLDSALIGFENVSSSAGLAHSIALAGAGACYEEQGNYEKAAGLFKKAATSTNNFALKPLYYTDAARNYELAGNVAEAILLQEILQDEFSDSKQGQNAKNELTRLKSLKAG